MLSLAEHARLKLIQRRSKENASSDANVSPSAQFGDQNPAVVGLRPVPQQRVSAPADSKSEADQFKQLLAAKAANRRVSEDVFVGDQSRGPPSNRPIPVNRSALPMSVSVDAEASAGRKYPPPLKQKTKSVVSDDNSFQVSDAN